MQSSSPTASQQTNAWENGRPYHGKMQWVDPHPKSHRVLFLACQSMRYRGQGRHILPNVNSASYKTGKPDTVGPTNNHTVLTITYG